MRVTFLLDKIRLSMLHAQFHGDIYRSELQVPSPGLESIFSPSQLTLNFFFLTQGMRSSCEVLVFINLKKALSGKYLIK